MGRPAEAVSRTEAQGADSVPGPDFPTGGLIVGRRGILEAYVTGRGGIQVRAKVEIETTKKGDREQIIVTEIPYQVNKAKLLERIAELVARRPSRASPTCGTNPTATGMRIVIELKRGEVAR